VSLILLGLAIALSLGCKKEPTDPCDIVAPEWEAELGRVQACDVDADCGLPLPGTGCGCTRNLVGNNDADTEQLYYILQLGDDLSCTLVQPTSCDCPDAKGFVCQQGVCAWDYVQAGT